MGLREETRQQDTHVNEIMFAVSILAGATLGFGIFFDRFEDVCDGAKAQNIDAPNSASDRLGGATIACRIGRIDVPGRGVLVHFSGWTKHFDFLVFGRSVSFSSESIYKERFGLVRNRESI